MKQRKKGIDEADFLVRYQGENCWDDDRCGGELVEDLLGKRRKIGVEVGKEGLAKPYKSERQESR